MSAPRRFRWRSGSECGSLAAQSTRGSAVGSAGQTVVPWQRDQIIWLPAVFLLRWASVQFLISSKSKQWISLLTFEGIKYHSPSPKKGWGSCKSSISDDKKEEVKACWQVSFVLWLGCGWVLFFWNKQSLPICCSKTRVYHSDTYASIKLEMSDSPPTPAAGPPTALDIIPDILNTQREWVGA